MNVCFYPASEQILNDLHMRIPWKLSGSPAASQVSKTEPLNLVKRPVTYWYEVFITTMLLPIIATVFVIRMIFKLDMPNYYAKYYE